MEEKSMSVRLYVKLPKAELEKEGFEKMFDEFEPSFSTKLIKERKKKECRGFGFVTVPNDEAAEDFINRYNEKPLIYNGEPFKDEDGKEFVLLIEKALPRKNNQNSDNASSVEEQEGNASNDKASRNTNKKGKKNRKNIRGKSQKGVSVSQSIQPDPRWADELNKLKEMFATQTSN
jgi:RNA recognition motif-containing protein